MSAFPVEHPARAPEAETILFLHGGNVANWMWGAQVDGLPEFHILTPDLPGFGTRAHEGWVSIPASADGLAALIAARATGGTAHVVGLSLGGVVAATLAARHPEVVRSLIVSGAVPDGVHGATRRIGLAQLAVWDQAWYWRAQARLFRLPADAREQFVETGLGITRANAERMMREVYDSTLPDGLERVAAPVLVVAGDRDSRAVLGGLPRYRERLPQAVVATAPGLHHGWNAEDPTLFTDMVRAWCLDGEVVRGLDVQA